MFLGKRTSALSQPSVTWQRGSLGYHRCSFVPGTRFPSVSLLSTHLPLFFSLCFSIRNVKIHQTQFCQGHYHDSWKPSRQILQIEHKYYYYYYYYYDCWWPVCRNLLAGVRTNEPPPPRPFDRSHDARTSGTYLSRSGGICLPRVSFAISLTASSNNSPQRTDIYIYSRILCLWRWQLEIMQFADMSLNFFGGAESLLRR